MPTPATIHVVHERSENAKPKGVNSHLFTGELLYLEPGNRSTKLSIAIGTKLPAANPKLMYQVFAVRVPWNKARAKAHTAMSVAY
jgi:hypothetical protein